MQGELTSYSSHGPARDGRTSPDIASPAELIRSALATGSDSFGMEVSADGLWMTTSGGTSAASPGVAGAVALLLEVHPELDLASLRQALAVGATVDASTGTTPSDAWGWGKLQVDTALATLDEVAPDADGDGYGAAAAGGLDCDDARADVSPAAPELPDNGRDDDCDGAIDEPLPSSGFFPRTDPACPGETIPDAGVDGGSGAPDAGEPSPDAATSADAAAPGADAEPTGGGVAGGACSCRTGAAPNARGEAVGLLGLVGLLAARRRRARG